MDTANSGIETERLREEIRVRCRRKYVILVGRATTGLYLALKATGRRAGEVIVQNHLCPSPANAVLFAGCTPSFCDVNLHDYNMNIDSFQETITDRTIGVLPAHLFGHPAEMNAISQIAEDRRLIVIEDAAQGFGGSYRGAPLGSFGDISVVSFGGKIINADTGGAVLTDDATIAGEIRRLSETLPTRPNNYKERYDQYKKIFYESSSCGDERERRRRLQQLPILFKDLYLYSFDPAWAEGIGSEMNNLDKNVQIRRQHLHLYRSLLSHENLVHPDYLDDEVIYRYSFLVDGDRQKELTDTIRRAGFDASNLYYVPLSSIYDTKTDRRYPNTQYISEHIVNLWMGPSVSTEYIENVCEVVNGGME